MLAGVTLLMDGLDHRGPSEDRIRRQADVTTRRDVELRRRVQAELDWEPDLREQEFALTVKDGVVSLWGQVEDDRQKHVAEAAAQRVSGISVVADELRVRSDGSLTDTDNEIAHTVYKLLKWHVNAPADSVKAMVENGWITLEGDVPLLGQRIDAERGLRQIRGVRGVTNRIRVT
jgi:osmotically-inducible protein OsmY